jgi:hypothetical protein
MGEQGTTSASNKCSVFINLKVAEDSKSVLVEVNKLSFRLVSMVSSMPVSVVITE